MKIKAKATTMKIFGSTHDVVILGDQIFMHYDDLMHEIALFNDDMDDDMNVGAEDVEVIKFKGTSMYSVGYWASMYVSHYKLKHA